MSATTPSSSFTTVKSCDRGGSTAEATNGADRKLSADARNGNPGRSLMSPSGADANRGGGGDHDFRGGFAVSAGGMGVNSGRQPNALSGQDERHAAGSHDDRLKRPQRHHHGCKEGKALGKAVSTARNFYTPSEIALRSRRLCSAYGGRGDGDGGWGSVSPRRADIARHTKVRP